jgi:hypothetical protein
VGAVLVLIALAAVDALRSRQDRASPSTETVPIPGLRLPAEQEVTQIAIDWARRFAARDSATCDHMSQPLCERLACMHVGGYKLRNCKLPTRAYRASFAEALIEDVDIKNYRATARFSNGEKIVLHGDGGTWMIIKLGGRAGTEEFE